MRCPKCHYISYDSGERCRNCGYEFSLAVDVADADLPIQTGNEPVGPLADLTLHPIDDALNAVHTGAGTTPQIADLDLTARPGRSVRLDDLRVGSEDLPEVVSRSTLTPGGLDVRGIEFPPTPEKGRLKPAKLAPDAPPAQGGRAWHPPEPREHEAELPLFNGRAQGLAAPRSVSAAPRPLAVRRPTPLTARRGSSVQSREPGLDLGLTAQAEHVAQDATRPPEHASITPGGADATVAAPPGLRLAAAAVDATILGGIDLGIVYLTLRLCGLGMAQIAAIPAAPMLAFLLLLAGGYLIAFTAAGGQTIGKMAFGIRVVPAHGYPRRDDRVALGSAVLRTVACLLTVIPVGLGFVPALIGPGYRGVHDRFANTRVVKA